MPEPRFWFYDAFAKCPKLASDGFHNILVADELVESSVFEGRCTWCGGYVLLSPRELELLDIRAEQRRAYRRGNLTQQHTRRPS